jgi:hypothetical protein
MYFFKCFEITLKLSIVMTVSLNWLDKRKLRNKNTLPEDNGTIAIQVLE